MKYLVKTIKHTTGEEFTNIIKVKNNEDYVIVEAESKEEAEEKVTGGKSRLFDVREVVLMSILPIWLFAGFIIFVFKFLL